MRGTQNARTPGVCKIRTPTGVGSTDTPMTSAPLSPRQVSNPARLLRVQQVGTRFPPERVRGASQVMRLHQVSHMRQVAQMSQVFGG
ncbi:hypothetical protein GCM10028771_06060 [Nocardioides marmoraquaticus]